MIREEMMVVPGGGETMIGQLGDRLMSARPDKPKKQQQLNLGGLNTNLV